MKPTLRFLACLPGLLLLQTPADAQTLTDFGYEAMKMVDGSLAKNRPQRCIVILLDDDLNGSFEQADPAEHYRRLVFGFSQRSNLGSSSPGSVNGFLLENSKGDFALSPAMGAAHPDGVIGPHSTTVVESDAIYNSWGNEHVIGRVALDVAVRNGLVLDDFDDAGGVKDGKVTDSELMLVVITNRPWRKREADGSFEVDAMNNILMTEINGLNRWIIADGTNYVPPNQPGGGVTKFEGRFAMCLEKVDFATLVHEVTHTLGTRDFYAYKDGGVTVNNRTTLMGPTISSTPEDPKSFHLDCWHKMALGWAEPRIVSMRQGGLFTIPAAQVGDATNPIILYEPEKGTTEFFMLEYRTSQVYATSTYDSEVIQDRVFLWHIQLNPASRLAAVSVPSTLNLLPDNLLNGVWTEGPLDVNGNIGISNGWGSNSTSFPLRWNNGVITPFRFNVYPFSSGATSVSVGILYENDKWVDFTFMPSFPFYTENGTFDYPFDTFIEGVNAVGYGGNLHIKPGTTPETITNLSKRMTITADYGPVTIGQP